jgi:5-methylcytosine-specific restriction endonuclease McrA
MEKSPATVNERCGTYAGYKIHRKRGEELCLPCREAMREYRREYHKKKPDKNKQYKNAYLAKPEKKAAVKEYHKKLYYSAEREERIRLKELERVRRLTNPTPEEIAEDIAKEKQRKKKASELQKRYRKNNPEKVKARAKKYGKENRAKLREYNRKRKLADPVAHARRNREAYQRNKDKRAEYSKKYYAQFPEKRRAMERRRRATRLKNGFDKYTEQDVLAIHGTICYICELDIDMNAARQPGQPGWEKGLQFDHVIPISRGGLDALHNVRPSHGKCNLSKNKKLPEEFKATV